jgi:hypothetical protein
VKLRPGVRLHSAVDETEVIVIGAPTDEVELECGGHPMLEPDASTPADLELDPSLADGTALGKRFADDATGLEVLCVKAGKGTLTLDGAVLPLKAAKALPASD